MHHLVYFAAAALGDECGGR